MQLTLQATWKGDLAEVNLAQDRANQLITLFLGQNPCDCDEACPVVPTGLDCGDDCMGCSNLVFQNGVLGCNCCGTFIPVPGQTGAAGQPGVGSPQPTPGGGLATYNVCLSASGRLFLPTPVSTGDIITINNPTGAWNDPVHDILVWRIWNGEQFLAGDGIPGTDETVSGDPSSTAPHMALIVEINGNFYDLSSGSLTVPGGVSNASALMQANDIDTTDDHGQICFDIQVQNNQVATWSHDFDFAVSNWGASLSAVGVGPAGAYTPGVGWTEAQFQDPAGQYYKGVRIDFPDAAGSYTITLADLLIGITAPNPAPSGGDTSLELLAHSGANTIVSFGSLVTGDPRHLVLSGLTETHSDLFVAVQSGYSPSAPPTAGLAHIYKLHLEGTGTDPF